MGLVNNMTAQVIDVPFSRRERLLSHSSAIMLELATGKQQLFWADLFRFDEPCHFPVSRQKPASAQTITYFGDGFLTTFGDMQLPIFAYIE